MRPLSREPGRRIKRAPSGNSAHSVRLFLCGDVMTGRGLDQVLPHPVDPALRERHVGSALTYVTLAERANGPIPRPARGDAIWGDALDEWRRMRPDLRFANLETAITHSDDFAPKGINYRMAPENAPCLLAAGLDACSLANNHALDFGRGGLIETLEVLRGLRLPAAGAGRNLAEARAPAVIPLPGRSARVIFAAAAFEDSGVPPDWRAGPHTPGLDLVEPGGDAARQFAARIAEVRGPQDIAVASIHWGSNWGYEVADAHRRFAHTLIDSGEISIVHGHSSHHPRPVEVYRNRLILYGCGDFLNDYEGIGGYERFRGDLVAMYFADLDSHGDLLGLELTPLAIRRFRLNRAAAADAEWLGKTLSRESAGFGASFRLAESGRLALLRA